MGKRSGAKRVAKEYGRLAGQLREHAGLALQVPAEMEERRRGAEEAYSMIRSSLGRPGTYDETAPAGAPTGGLFKASTARAGELSEASLQKLRPGAQTLDPTKVAQATMDSPEFRIASRLTAESEQMLKREGPLWEEMNKSVMGGIIEGSSALMREQSEVLRKQFARGGSARNRARQGMQEIRAMEAANTARQQNVWQSSLALNKWARDNARTQLEFNQGWAANVAGVRESFQGAMDDLGKFIVQGAIPISGQLLSEATEAAAAYHTMRAAASKSKLKRITSIATGAAALIGSAIFPAAAPALLPTALGGIMGGVGGPEIGAMGAEIGGIPQVQEGFQGRVQSIMAGFKS